jgi:hypothetical protein
LATTCSHAESRLTCVECSEPICGKCMVQCPVGFRCKTCAGSSNKPQGSSKGLVSLRMVSIRTFAICAAMGFGAAWLMPFINVPYISCIICFFLGVFAGQQLAKTIDYRIRGTATTIIVFGILFGMSFTPLAWVLPMLSVEAFSALTTGQDFFGALLNIVSFLFTPIGFILGVLRSTS